MSPPPMIVQTIEAAFTFRKTSFVVYELCFTKVKLIFVGGSGSNHSVFYFYVANSVGFSSTPCHAHA